MQPGPKNDITDVKGIKVGHAQDKTLMSGTTVILPDNAVVASVDCRGGAPGTRETEVLNPANLVEEIHAIVLSGGSAMGLDAASGVASILKDRGIGVLITDHNVRETLDVIDRAYIIHDVMMLMEGAPRDIVGNEEVRRVYLGERFSL